MTENIKQTIFRKKTLERISSPEQLTDYLQVTNPGIWVVLGAVILLLTGIFAWSMVSTLETCVDVTVVVEDHIAQVVPTGCNTLTVGLPLYVAWQKYMIASVETDEYGRMTGKAEIELPDGVYEGRAAVEETHPIDFLLSSR